ncbi:hypothetical protein BQ8794_30350 [Mesorhizobium prunaredense]|uniref:Uncharacterized protein n=1 Tax=Mesorhizobium prunaredense TaxID=1631249 RepID=A0A1R3VES4_9HYPH|nr:hypothetical protein BQ8794_30350 [Mesorhizobium prunaredense]
MASAQFVGRTGPWIARNPQHSAIGPGIFDSGFDADKLRSYGVARRQVVAEVVHWSHKGLTTGRRTRIGPAFGGFEAKLPLP